MEQPDYRIQDKDLALRLALAEKPLRELAIQAIQEGLPTSWAEAASGSADEASDRELDRYYDEVELQRRAAEIKELSDTPTVSATKAELARFGAEAGYRPPVATKVFNDFRSNVRMLVKYGLDDAFDPELQAIRLNEQIITVLSEIFTGHVPLRFVKEYYVAHGGSITEDAAEVSAIDQPDIEMNPRKIKSWTISKNVDPAKNEDAVYSDKSVLVLADGATDKSGIVYPSGMTGGKELAAIATAVAARSTKTGYELIDEVTKAVQEFYGQHNPAALEDASKRAASTLVAARIIDNNLVITQVGDTNIRLTMKDGTTQIITNDKAVDNENATTRSAHIMTELARFVAENRRVPSDGERDSIVASGRGVIQQRLNTQYLLQNSTTDNHYGYGIVDGTTVPRTFDNGEPTNYVKTYTVPVAELASIELVSDGFYGEFPEAPTVAEYRDLYERLHSEDPDKYLKYLSTKPKDDATVLIAKLD